MFAAYVALSKPILVVVNTILFIYWLIRLRYWLWIPLTGLIVNYEYITSMYQIYNPTKYANENRLKVVTYNVHSFGNEITGFSAKEFAVLEFMIRNKGSVLSREAIENNVWSYDWEGGTNVVDVYMSYLRRKLDAEFDKKLIHTVRGVGWVLRDEA